MTMLRSGCPINLTLEAIGDRWSLIVIRDIMFGNRRHFRDLLGHSVEGIATNILADRLKKLVAQGLLTRRDDPAHSQKAIYSLTAAAIDLVPLIVAMGAWGRRHRPATPELSIRAQLMEDGGPTLQQAFMAELRHLHLGTPLPPRHRSVHERLDAAYRRACAAEASRGRGKRRAAAR